MDHNKNCDYLETVKGVHKTLPDGYKARYKVLKQRNEVLVVQRFCPICKVDIGPKEIVPSDNNYIGLLIEEGRLEY